MKNAIENEYMIINIFLADIAATSMVMRGMEK